MSMQRSATTWPAVSFDWKMPVSEARAYQRNMAAKVVASGTGTLPRTVAGVDAAFHGRRVRAAAVVLSLPDLQTIAVNTAEMPCDVSYRPGMLAFREGPAVTDALRGLTFKPDATLFDGHGQAHPRRFGIASHIGILLDLAAIGCAKTCLTGRWVQPEANKGSFSCLTDAGETIGAVVRTRSGVKPVFVSVGHRIGLETAVNVVGQCCRRYRIPEPLRLAHRLCQH